MFIWSLSSPVSGIIIRTTMILSRIIFPSPFINTYLLNRSYYIFVPLFFSIQNVNYNGLHNLKSARIKPNILSRFATCDLHIPNVFRHII